MVNPNKYYFGAKSTRINTLATIKDRPSISLLFTHLRYFLALVFPVLLCFLVFDPLTTMLKTFSSVRGCEGGLSLDDLLEEVATYPYTIRQGMDLFSLKTLWKSLAHFLWTSLRAHKVHDLQRTNQAYWMKMELVVVIFGRKERNRAEHGSHRRFTCLSLCTLQSETCISNAVLNPSEMRWTNVHLQGLGSYSVAEVSTKNANLGSVLRNGHCMKLQGVSASGGGPSMPWNFPCRACTAGLSKVLRLRCACVSTVERKIHWGVTWGDQNVSKR